MGRFGNSWKVFKQSLNVLSHDKELLLLPIVSFFASLIVVASFVYPSYATGLLERVVAEDENAQYVAGAVAFVMYLILSFITVYFNAGIMHAANLRMDGVNPTLGNALSGPSKQLGRIFLWAIFAATMALLIRVIEGMLRDRAGPIFATIFGFLAGAAWWMATYFAIPVVLFEGRHVGPALKRSTQLFKQRWGESLIGEFGLSFAVTLLALAGLIPLLIGFYIGLPIGWVFIGAAVLWWIFVAALGPALSAIYKTALYRFAARGQLVPEFTPDVITGSWRSKTGPPPTGGFRPV